MMGDEEMAESSRPSTHWEIGKRVSKGSRSWEIERNNTRKRRIKRRGYIVLFIRLSPVEAPYQTKPDRGLRSQMFTCIPQYIIWDGGRQTIVGEQGIGTRVSVRAMHVKEEAHM